MSFNAFAIMLKPVLANYLAPLEENGTIAKLQADIELVAKSGAIPEFAQLVKGLERHNELLEKLTVIIEMQGMKADERAVEYPGQPDNSATADSLTGTTGFDGNDGAGMLTAARPD